MENMPFLMFTQKIYRNILLVNLLPSPTKKNSRTLNQRLIEQSLS